MRSFLVVGAILTLGISFIGAVRGYNIEMRNLEFASDTQSDIDSFKRQSDTYISRAHQEQVLRLPLPERTKHGDLNILGVPGFYLQENELELAFFQLSPVNRQIAYARLLQQVAEFNASVSGNEGDLKVHSPETLSTLERSWELENPIKNRLHASGYGLLLGFPTFVICALIWALVYVAWWFMLDRIRDVASAIRRS